MKWKLGMYLGLAGAWLLNACGDGSDGPVSPAYKKASHSHTVTEVRQLTADPAEDITPSWSADGRWIAFASRRSGNFDIWLTTPAADTLIQTTTRPYHEMNPSWRPHGLELAYVVYTEGSRGNIRVTNPFGNHTAQITYLASGVREVPSWSPMGEQVAFSAFVSGNWDIWVASLNGPVPRKVTQDQSTDLAPSWGPDGRRIAFSSDRSGNPDVWLYYLDEQRAQQLTHYPGSDDFPAFSPDGNHIAFSSTRAMNMMAENDIWLYCFLDNSFQRLTDGAGDDIHPQWAPDGRGLVFASNRGGNYDIWLLKLEIR